MSKQRFAEILKEPYNLDNDTMLFIEELRDKHPYCQTVQILLAKCYQKNNSPQFEKQVNIASAYSIDRKQFQNYISEKLHFDKPQDDNSDILKDNSEQKDITSEEGYKETKIEPSVKPAKEEADPDERKKQLEEIVQQRINSFKKKKVAGTESKEAPIIPSTVIPGKKTSKTNTRTEQIIEQFIREEPRISSPKDASPSENDLSEESVKFYDDIISETLAEIYLRQGKINQSLDIYNKLSLKFPEKSSYFAKKIERIKNNTT